jgi:hypothetical protein
MSSDAVKFDSNKLRLDLIPDTAIRSLGNVLTFGAEKYSDRNWEHGLKWSRVIGAAKRHLTAIERREDFDPESKLLHVEHLLANVSFLNHFYTTYPEGDDRPYTSIKHRRLGLDLDGVIANFLKTFKNTFPDEVDVDHWTQESSVEDHMNSLSDDFWLSLEPLVIPNEIPVEPVCYITKRVTCKPEIATEWLRRNGFPMAPVLFSSKDRPKSVIAKEMNVDIFVDDKYSNFLELNNNGVVCFLMNQPHNIHFDVGYKRIYSLQDLVTRFRLF